MTPIELTLTLKNLGYLIALIIGVQVSIVLIYFGFRRFKANLLLGISYLITTYGVFIAGLISSGAMIYFPSLYRTGNLAGLLFAPLLYLYVRQVIQDRTLTWKDLIHIIPFLIFLVDFWPIYFLPIQEKSVLILSEINNPAEYTAYNQTRFFPSNFHGNFRTLLIFIYWALSMRLIYKRNNRITKAGASFEKAWLSWMKIYLFFLLLIFLPYILFSGFLSQLLLFDLLHFSAALLIIGSGFALLFYPKLLYGLDEFEFIKNEKIGLEENLEKNSLSEEKIKEISDKIELVVFKDQAYLEKGYTLSDLARDTETPSYLLTIYINSYLQSSFSELINKGRIKHSVSMIEEGFLKGQTIEGLAYSCGFNNRNSFISAFKKYQGQTPSSYKKSFETAYCE